VSSDKRWTHAVAGVALLLALAMPRAATTAAASPPPQGDVEVEGEYAVYAVPSGEFAFASVRSA
jgi:hypothetical protein